MAQEDWQDYNLVHGGSDKTLVIITYILMFFTAVIGPLIV